MSGNPCVIDGPGRAEHARRLTTSSALASSELAIVGDLGENSSVHYIVHFEPKAGGEAAVRLALTSVAALSRAEPGCRRFQLFESLQEPTVFAIHSEWIDEAAFALHATLPHTRAFLAEIAPLLMHEVRGLRLRALANSGGDMP